MKAKKYNLTVITLHGCLKKNEEQGNIGFPIKRYDESILKDNANIIFSIFHHPYVWQKADNSKYLIEVLEKTSSIIITGHVHERGESIKHDLVGGFTEYIEGGVLQDSDNKYKSDFNLVFIDLSLISQQILSYTFNPIVKRYDICGEKSLTFKELKGIIYENQQFPLLQ